jgi:ABC-type uncharacterized transport system permease subunit
MKNAVFWDVTLCDSYKNQSFGGTFASIIRVIRTVVPSSPIVVTLMMEAILSSETSVLTRATRHNTSDDGILVVKS